MLKTGMLSVSIVMFGICASFAQGPELTAPIFRRPVISAPEAFQDTTPIPAVTPDVELGPVLPGAATGGAIVVPQGGLVQPGVPVLDGAPMALTDCQCQFYNRVCYKDKKKIAPCAATMVVSVIDPCTRKCDCETRCVQVKICVPTCGCAKVKVTRNGRHTRYDYGKYAIDIFSNRNGTVTVDYDA